MAYGTWRTLPVAALTLWLVACGAQDPPQRLVLIVVDTLRVDAISAYGGSVPTPHIDALAERGLRYTAAVASFHQTPMSMSALFTGLTPSLEGSSRDHPLPLTGPTSCGLARLGRADRRGGCVPESVETLAEVLRGTGYWTAGVVSNSLLFAPFGIQQGFDAWREVGGEFLPPGARTRERSAKLFRSRDAAHVNQGVEALLRERPSDHFFLYVHYMDAHDYRGRADAYWQRSRAVDRGVGSLLALLEAEDLLEEAVVILTSDHGERLGERHVVPGSLHHGGNPSFEEVLRVPLIIAPGSATSRIPPEAIPHPDSPVRTQDVFDLVARLAGRDVVRAQDLLPDELFISEERWQTYRRGRFKSFVRRGDGRQFTIDLSTDPKERRDVSALHPESAARHREAIERIATALASEHEAAPRTPEFEARLRALGYLE